MTPEGSTHVDTAFTGTTSSFSRTASGKVAVVAVVRQRVFAEAPWPDATARYRVNNSIATSMRYYANANRYPWAPAHDRTPVVQAPVGLTFVTYENPPGIRTANERVRAFKTRPQAEWFNHVNINVNVNAHDHGGHFIPWENPDAWVSDLRRTFHGRRP